MDLVFDPFYTSLSLTYISALLVSKSEIEDVLRLDHLCLVGAIYQFWTALLLFPAEYPL